MAEIFDFYVNDNRSITFKLSEPIMLEDNGVSDWRFHIPNTVNGLDATGWQWWLVYVNARNDKYTIPLTLEYDYDRPDAYSIATYTVDYGMSCKVGNVKFSLEAIDADTGGTILHEWHTKTYATNVVDTLQGNQVEYAETESDIISALLIEVRNKVNQLVGGATPTPVSAVSEMLDTDKIYLLTTDGEWYYYNGTAWVSGGVYGAGVVDPVPTQGSSNAVSSGGVYDAMQSAGLSEDAKTALLACFRHVAWIDGHGQNYYDALEAALNNADYPMITASYVSSGHVVHANDSLESLRPYLTVVYYETAESSGTTVTDYTLSTASPLIPGVNNVTVQYNGFRSQVSINVANPIYEYVPPEESYSINAKWVDHTQIEGLYGSVDGYLPVKGLSVSGVTTTPSHYWYAYIACPQEKTGRATSNTQIIVGNFDGKKIGLHSYVLSSGATVSFNVLYGLINDDNSTFSGYLVYETEDVEELKKFGGWTFYNSEQTLPTSASTNLRFVEVSFRKGDSSADFTDAEIAELVGLLYIE